VAHWKRVYYEVKGDMLVAKVLIPDESLSGVLPTCEPVAALRLCVLEDSCHVGPADKVARVPRVKTVRRTTEPSS
jgi:hypothetical protein